MVKLSSPEGCELISDNFDLDVKHDGRHKTRLVSDGHLTDVPISIIYSVVVSLRGIIIVLFVAKSNELYSWGTDIGNACLEEFTKQKFYVKTGREFGTLEDHILIINKALRGLRTSGLR